MYNDWVGVVSHEWKVELILEGVTLNNNRIYIYILLRRMYVGSRITEWGWMGTIRIGEQCYSIS